MTLPTPTNDSAFLRAIVADPDDDAPRLVYADWLEDSGDPSRVARAELIRFQVAAARARPDDPKAGEAVPELLAQTWVPTWDYALPQIPNCKWGPYRRGFIDEVTLQPVIFFTYGGRILSAIPLRRVRLLLPARNEIRRLLSRTDIRAVPELLLEGYGWDLDAALRVLADAGPWPDLRRLVVNLSPAWAERENHSTATALRIREAIQLLRQRFDSRLEVLPGWQDDR